MNDVDNSRRFFEQLYSVSDGITEVMSFVLGAAVVGLINGVVVWYVPLLTVIGLICGIIAMATLRVLLSEE